MQHLIAKSQQKRAESDKGFTLIELLVVVVIIGILVAIAVPVYLNYRKGALNKAAQSDIRAAISTVEQFYAENNNAYPVGATAVTSASGVLTLTGTAVAPATAPTVNSNVSAGTELGYLLVPAASPNPAFYMLCARNVDANKWFVYNGLKGGAVKEAAVQTGMTGCLGGDR